MKYKKDLTFAEIFRNSPIKKGLIKVFENSFKINLKFFHKKPEKFKIYICDSEKDFKKYAKPYYSKNATAVGLGIKGITTRSPEFIEKLGYWKKKDFPNLMNHEISHIFYSQICKTWSPQWFVEGLANNIGKNFSHSNKEIENMVKKYKINYKILDFRYQRKNFKKGNLPRYPIWQAFTEFLIKKFSLKKIRIFIKEYSKNTTKKRYEKIFKKVFGKSDKVLFNEFIKKSSLS